MKTRYTEINGIYDIGLKLSEPEKKSTGYILAVHDLGGDMECGLITQLAKRMTAHGLAVVSFDLPGHGMSSASEYLSLHNCRRDMLDVIRYADAEYSVPAPAAVFAIGFGGYVTLLNAEELHPMTDIVLLSPAVDMQRSSDRFRCSLKIPESFRRELERNRITGRDISREMLIIHGSNDETVTTEDIRSFCKDAPKAVLRIIEGADHGFSSTIHIQQAIDIAAEYITEV